MHTNGITKLLSGVAGATLVMGLAVSAGAVPRPGANNAVHTATVAPAEELGAPAARQPGDTAKPPAAPAAIVSLPPAPPQRTTTVAKPGTTTPPTTKAPARSTQAATPATPAAAIATTVPAAVAKVARRTPTAAEINTVIAELKRQVGGLLLLVSPTAAQINQAGDQVCTAFDNGQTFAQVKATGLSLIPASVTVPPSTADWAVRQAVTLYCPGHASKLV